MFKIKDDELLDIKVEVKADVSAYPVVGIWENAEVEFSGRMTIEIILSFKSGINILLVDILEMYNECETKSTISLGAIFKSLLDLDKQGELENKTTEEVTEIIKKLVDFELNV